MAAYSLAENIVAALVCCSNGDLGVSLEEAVRGVERWQREKDCHFGTWRHDVRSSLQILWFFDQDLRTRCDSSATVLGDLTLAEALPILGKYKHWYANDEGAYWDEPTRRFANGEDGAICSTSFRSYEMQRFFSRPEATHSTRVVRFLQKLGFDAAHFRRCSRPGCSS